MKCSSDILYEVSPNDMSEYIYYLYLRSNHNIPPMIKSTLWVKNVLMLRPQVAGIAMGTAKWLYTVFNNSTGSTYIMDSYSLLNQLICREALIHNNIAIPLTTATKHAENIKNVAPPPSLTSNMKSNKVFYLILICMKPRQVHSIHLICGISIF